MKIPATKTSIAAAEPVRAVRPVATATLEPASPRQDGREHTLKIVLELVAGKRNESTVDKTRTIVMRTLAGFAPAAGDPDRRSIRELSTTRRALGGPPTVLVTSLEVTVTWAERPAEEAIETFASLLAAEGYRVVLRERRECTQVGCASDAFTGWRRPQDIPSAWFDPVTCGKHDFKRCPGCRSVYHLISQNAAGQSPAIRCEVCHHVLIEWGSSKRWEAELVSRG